MPPVDTLLQDLLLIDGDVQLRLLATVIGLALILVARWLVIRSATARIKDTNLLYRWRKGAEYTAVVLIVWLCGRIWFNSNFSLSTYLGLLSAGLAVALHDPITNLVGWLFIIWRRPFTMGDRIQVGDQAGDVVDMGYFQFKMLEIGNWVHADQSTGRLLHVPNRMVFSTIVANYTKGFNYIWNEIPVMITFESDWRKAKALVTEIVQVQTEAQGEAIRDQLRSAAQQHMIYYERLTPIVYTNVADSGIVLTLRYLCEPRRRRSTSEAIWEHILTAFAEHDDIQLAYPTQRIYFEEPRAPQKGAPDA